MMALRCAVPRLEAALAEGLQSVPCPLIGVCRSSTTACVIFAPGWWCEETQLCVLPDLVRDCDEEPDNDYG